MRKVTFPEQPEVIRLTGLVVLGAFIFGAYLWTVDNIAHFFITQLLTIGGH